MAKPAKIYRPAWWEHETLAAILHSARTGGTYDEVAGRVGSPAVTGKALSSWLQRQRHTPGCNAYAKFTAEYDKLHVNRTSVTSEQAIAAELETALGLVLSLCDCGAVKEVYSDDACVECLRLESATHRGVSAKTASKKVAA